MEKVDNGSEFRGLALSAASRRVDVHQHLWPHRLFELLGRRRRSPSLWRSGRQWILRIDGELEYQVAAVDHDPYERSRQVREDGLDRALIALSSPLGIESLPPDEAGELLEAYNDGVAELPDCFGGWGAAGLTDLDPDDVDSLLDRGFVGISLPAGALASPAGLDYCGPLLERLERRDAPLLVHPGPAPWRRRSDANYREPGWWPSMTDYISDLSSAWHAFIAVGRPAHPDLRVVFAALAGGAPLHSERLAARGGPREPGDERIFYDSSSYGERMIDAMIRTVGVEQIVYGSDRPVVTPSRPGLGDAAHDLMIASNPERLLGVQRVAS